MCTVKHQSEKHCCSWLHEASQRHLHLWTEARKPKHLGGTQGVIGCNRNIACANSAVHAMFLLHFPCGPKGPTAGAKRPHAAEGREGERCEAVVPEATD